VLIALGFALRSMFRGRRQLIGKLLLILGCVLVAPLLAVLATGHAESMRDWSDAVIGVVPHRLLNFLRFRDRL
jgi:uncharacterized membrane protein YkvI